MKYSDTSVIHNENPKLTERDQSKNIRNGGYRYEPIFESDSTKSQGLRAEPELVVRAAYKLGSERAASKAFCTSPGSCKKSPL